MFLKYPTAAKYLKVFLIVRGKKKYPKHYFCTCSEHVFKNTTVQTHHLFRPQVAEDGGAKWFNRDAVVSPLHITPPLQCIILFFRWVSALKGCHRCTAQLAGGSQQHCLCVTS